MGRSAFHHYTHFPNCCNNFSLTDKYLLELGCQSISSLTGNDSHLRSLRHHGNTRRKHTSLLVIHLSSSHNDIPDTSG